MKTSLFGYNLPKERIAQKPLKKRDSSKLMAVNKRTQKIKITRFKNIIDFLGPNDVLVFNDTKVFPARLIMKKIKTGGETEVFLLKKNGPNAWNCLIGGRKKREKLELESEGLSAKIIRSKTDGTWDVRFNLAGKKFLDKIFKIGKTPTPPYIKRRVSAVEYQTAYARRLGSVAAPTAGFHFTPELISKIRAQGVETLFITLHVGLGTFAPIKTGEIEQHKLHPEFARIDKNTAERLNRAIKSKKRIVAVGTTTARTLEGLIKNKKFSAEKKWVNSYIYPGYKFKAISAIITNFHLPQSSLLVLVSALSSRKLMLKAYRKAIKEKFRFYSFGDGMFIY